MRRNNRSHTWCGKRVAPRCCWRGWFCVGRNQSRARHVLALSRRRCRSLPARGWLARRQELPRLGGLPCPGQDSVPQERWDSRRLPGASGLMLSEAGSAMWEQQIWVCESRGEKRVRRCNRRQRQRSRLLQRAGTAPSGGCHRASPRCHFTQEVQDTCGDGLWWGERGNDRSLRWFTFPCCPPVFCGFVFASSSFGEDID